MERGDPRRHGIDPERLERVGAALERDVAARRCDGAALLVGRAGELVLEEYRGFADRARGTPVRPETVFVSMSIGKQFTNALVLERVERGALALHAPVAEVLPEFGARGKGRVTLFHLLTHTGGVVSAVPGLSPEALTSIERLAAFAADATPESRPGERVTYSILAAHAVLAAMVLRVDATGRRFARILEEELFAPLGMADTSLGPRADLLARLAPVVARYKEPGLFAPEDVEELGELVEREGSEIPAGGYLTTARDVLRFAEMLRRGGELDGHRLLSPATVELASRNHTGDRPNSLLEYTLDERGWAPWPASIGLGFFVRGEGIVPGPFGNLSSPRTFGGWGAGSTCFWIDPERELSFVLLTTGLMEDSRHIERVGRLSDLVTASLVD